MKLSYYGKQELVNKNLGRESDLEIKMFIDFDTPQKTFYYNLYLNRSKSVIKIAITPSLNNGNKILENIRNEILEEDFQSLKTEKFDISKYVYLLSLD